jgi:hypothetical protein
VLKTRAEGEALGSNDQASASARARSTEIARDSLLQGLMAARLAAMTAGVARPKKHVELAFNEQQAPRRGNAQLR